MDEISLWHEVEHANILPLCGLFWSSKAEVPALVSPWCEDGDIVTYIKQQETGIERDSLKLQLVCGMLSSQVRLTMLQLCQVLDGLTYCELSSTLFESSYPPQYTITRRRLSMVISKG